MPSLPSLPQNDRASRRRGDQLTRTRSRYAYDHTSLAPLAVVQDVPREESFTTGFNIGFLKMLSSVIVNLGAAKVRSWFDPFDALDDYADLFPTLTDPSVIPTWQSDWRFARQRIDGVNPVVLQRVDPQGGAPKWITEAIYGRRFQNRSLAADLADGRLYLVEYPLLTDLPAGSWDGKRKYLPLPRALFTWVDSGFRDRGELVPVCIELADPTGNRVISTPDDGARWLRAKIALQIADGNHYEMSTHLCRTHLVMEPFAVATPRQLAENHPLHLLLEPHLRFLLARNEEARNRLIQQGGFVDQLLGSSLDGSHEIIRRSFRAWNFHEQAFPREIASRGLDDAAMLADYPYRDDGMLLWDAITTYVEEYLGLYYPDDLAVRNDTELRAWTAELVSDDGGRIPGLTADNKIETLATLCEVVTQVIFTCGPQHSAVNFPQWDYLAYAPNMPLAGYQPELEPGADLLGLLPPQGQAVSQLEIMGALALYRYDRLGDYDDQFQDPRAKAVLTRFQNALTRIEREIVSRNSRRRSPYPYMLPSNIINSISV